MKNIIYIILSFSLLTGIIFLLSFAVTDHKHLSCNKIEISFTDHTEAGFIDEDIVSQIISKQCNTLVGQFLDSINTDQIISILNKNPYIKNASVFKSVSGEIQIDVERHIPVVRIINQNNENYYLSQSGNVLPLSNNFTPLVIVASGYIAENYLSVKDSTFSFKTQTETKQNMLTSIQYLSVLLSQNNFLNRYIEQIYINQQSEIEMVPADGSHYIILGDANQLPGKLNNLMAFYRDGIQKMDSGLTSVNLKFANQVVCQK